MEALRQMILVVIAAVLVGSTGGCSVLQVQSRMENGIWREEPGAEIERLNWFTGVGNIKPQGSPEKRQVLLDFGGTVTDQACSHNCAPGQQVRREEKIRSK
jgi:hypothetical protein